MMIILVCQIGGAIAGFVYSQKISEVAKTEMLTSMGDFDDKPSEDEWSGATKSWNIIQTQVAILICVLLGGLITCGYINFCTSKVFSYYDIHRLKSMLQNFLCKQWSDCVDSKRITHTFFYYSILLTCCILQWKVALIVELYVIVYACLYELSNFVWRERLQF